MKNYAKKILLLLLAIGMVFLLSGCEAGVDVDSQMTIQEDFSGSREIEAVFAKSDLTSKAKLTTTSLESIIRNNCPSGFTWKRASSGSNYIYTFTLSFTDAEDYKNKITSILGKENQVQFDVTNELYKEGFQLKENFYSSDLLEWLKDAIQSKKNLTNSQIEDLFEEAGCTLIYNGKTVRKTSSNLEYTSLKEVSFKQIDYLTEIRTDDLYNRVIRWQMQMDVSDKKQEEIKEHFKVNLPSNAKGNWSYSQNNVIYTAALEGMDKDQLISSTQTLMQSKIPGYQITNSNSGMFKFSNEYKESIDLSAFLSNDAKQIPFSYYVKDDQGRTIENGQADGESPVQDNPDDVLTEGYELLYNANINQAEVSYSMPDLYTIKNITVNTEVGWKNKYERNIVLYYDRVPKQQEREAVWAAFTNLASDAAEVTIVPQEGEFALAVKMTGSSEELSNAFHQIFGGNSSISYNQDYMGIFRFSAPYEYKETMDFTQFLPEGVNPPVSSHTSFLGGETISTEETENSGTVGSDGKSYDATVDAANYNVSIVTIQKSYLPIFLFVILAVLVIAIAFIIYHILHERRKKRQEEEKDISYSEIFDEEDAPEEIALTEEEEELAKTMEKELQGTLAREVEKTIDKTSEESEEENRKNPAEE